MDFYRKLTGFLEQYLEIPDSFYRADRILQPVAAAYCLQELIREQVFDFPELQATAYHEAGILITRGIMEGTDEHC